MLTNIIGNAAKYSDTGSRIDIGISPAEDGTVKITIAGQGIGISNENVKHIFGKFYKEDQG